MKGFLQISFLKHTRFELNRQAKEMATAVVTNNLLLNLEITPFEQGAVKSGMIRLIRRKQCVLCCSVA